MSDGSLSMILAALIRLEGKADGLEAGQRGLMARLDRHEDQLSTIRDDIAVSVGRADQASLVASNTRDEARLLGQQVALQQRQISKLQTRVDALEPKT